MAEFVMELAPEAIQQVPTPAALAGRLLYSESYLFGGVKPEDKDRMHGVPVYNGDEPVGIISYVSIGNGRIKVYIHDIPNSFEISLATTAQRFVK